MRQILIIILACVVSSCTFKPYTATYSIDFTRYMEEDFTVSSLADFTGRPYIALGNVIVEHYEGRDGLGHPIDPVTIQKMVDLLVEKAIAMGANGVISVNVTAPIHQVSASWFASGVAVKFKDNVKENNSVIFKKYDMQKAQSIAAKEKIALVAFAKKDGVRVYFDPDTNLYFYKNQFIRKYGHAVLEELIKQHSNSKIGLKN